MTTPDDRTPLALPAAADGAMPPRQTRPAAPQCADAVGEPAAPLGRRFVIPTAPPRV